MKDMDDNDKNWMIRTIELWLQKERPGVGVYHPSIHG
jgi:hypothetical protein